MRLVRTALSDIGFKKHRLYEMNFLLSSEFSLGDIREINEQSVATVDLATASFPCTDLSLAGNRKGVAGKQSGAFHEFARILEEMGPCRPAIFEIGKQLSGGAVRRQLPLVSATRPTCLVEFLAPPPQSSVNNFSVHCGGQ
ncbi:MAG: DNA cytosine methyltransferase [Vulcanimicrobiaceae bacterium]